MVVAITSKDLRLGVICQSNLDIAGFLRKLFSISLGVIPLGSRAYCGSKLRIPRKKD